MIENFHFIRPLWLLAGIPCALILWAFVRQQTHHGAWHKVCDPALLPHILLEQNLTSRVTTLPLILSAVAGIIALAGPAWERLPQPVFRNPSVLVVGLDLSASMRATDAKPSRLGRAKFKIADLLKLRKDGQTALLVFATQAYTVTPLTDDIETINAHLPALGPELMPHPGSDAEVAIEAAGELLTQTGAPQGDLLLVTDGLGGADPEELAKQARAYRLRVSVLAAGTREGSPIPAADGGFTTDSSGAIVISHLEEQPLASLAAKTGGRYQRMTTDNSDFEALQNFFQKSKKSTAELAPKLQSQQWREMGPWLVLALLPIAAFAFRRGRLIVVGLLVLSLPVAQDPAHAQVLDQDKDQTQGQTQAQPVTPDVTEKVEQNRPFDWSSLWLNSDQRAKRSLQAGKAARAAELFQDPSWKAAAEYQSGQFAHAAETLETLADNDESNASNDTLYNRGNALARTGQYQTAIEQYDKVLSDDPEHEDAKFNRQLLEDLLKQQAGENESQNDKNNQENQSNDPGFSEQQESEQQQQSDQSQSSTENAQTQNEPGSEGENQSGRPDSDSDKNPGEPPDPSDQQQADSQPGQHNEAQQRLEPQTGENSKEPDRTEQMLAEEQANEAESEDQQATEQWLRRIPDDPGGLLRRKFLYQYRQRGGPSDHEGDPW